MALVEGLFMFCRLQIARLCQDQVQSLDQVLLRRRTYQLLGFALCFDLLRGKCRLRVGLVRASVLDMRRLYDLGHVLFHFVAVSVFHALSLCVLGTVLDLLLHDRVLAFRVLHCLGLAADSPALLCTGALLLSRALLVRLFCLWLRVDVVLGRAALLKLWLA